MSYLLGSKACMESLAADVQDVQETIKEVTSRVGPVQARSWKFPDKKACDLDIDDLLDLYDYDGDDVDDPEAKQVSHIALYELVIDRLIFLIQAVSKFCSTQFSAGQVGVKLNTNVDMKMAGSVGVIIKQYWTYVVKLQSQYQQLVSENKSKDTKIRELEKERSTSPSDDNLSCPSTSSMNTSKSSGIIETPGILGVIETPGILGIIPPNNADLILLGKTNFLGRSSVVSISKDLNNKSSQTFETALVPCESCDVIQRKLRETGEVIIKVCTDQGLPCSLKKFKAEVSHVEMLSFSDVCRWMVEQNKDVARIGKQSTVLQASIDPLKADVKTFEQRTKAAEEKAQTCEKNAKDELDVRTHLCKQYESKLKDQEKHYNELIAEEERQKSELKKNKENLEKEVARVRQEVQKNKDVLRELEESYTRLENDLEEKKKVAEQTAEHTQDVADLKSKLAVVTAALESHSKTLAREQGKSRSANRHNESLQAKQDSLLARMDVLGKENEDLSNQVASLEEEKTLLEDTLNTMREETKSLDNKLNENEITIKDLETEKRSLEKCMREAEMSIQALESELQEVKEREKMIVEYPDLNGPVNMDLQGSGDVAVDMKNQITANTIRIRILEEQNQTLSQSIQRLSTLRSSPAAKAPSEHVSVKLVPLWQNNSGLLASQRNNNSSHQHNEEWTWNGHSSDKMFSSQQHMGHPENSDQSKHKLYARTHAKKDEDYSRNYQGSGSRTSPQEFLVSRGNTPTSQLQREDKSLRQQRPLSGKLSSLTAPVNATPIGAYTHMKKALGIMSGKDSTLKGLPPSGKQPLGKTTSYMPGGDTRTGLGSGDGRSTPFSCPHCDKVYLSSKDLDIHLTYCIQ